VIKFEHNTLVLNSIFTKDDVAEIDAFTDYIRNDERKRLIKLLQTYLEPCECGTECSAWDSGFEEAIDILKNSGHKEDAS
jgi:hypothetical protein